MTIRPKRQPPAMIYDAATEARVGAITGSRTIANNPDLDQQYRLFIGGLVLPMLLKATTVHWASHAFDLAAASLRNTFDPTATDSSLDPSDVFNGVEWWYFDDPPQANGPSGPFTPVALLLYTRDAMRGINLESEDNENDLWALIFVHDPETKESLAEGLYAWRSDRPVSEGGVVARDMADEHIADVVSWGGLFANAGVHWRRTKLAVREQRPISRGTRRRLAKTAPELLDRPLIITLRAHESAPAQTADRHFEYTCSFVQRKHRRHLADGRVITVKAGIKNKHLPFRGHDGIRVEIKK